MNIENAGTIIIPLTSLDELKGWMKQEYAKLKHSEDRGKALRQSYHTRKLELIWVADQIGLDLIEGNRSINEKE